MVCKVKEKTYIYIYIQFFLTLQTTIWMYLVETKMSWRIFLLLQQYYLLYKIKPLHYLLLEIIQKHIFLLKIIQQYYLLLEIIQKKISWTIFLLLQQYYLLLKIIQYYYLQDRVWIFLMKNFTGCERRMHLLMWICF